MKTLRGLLVLDFSIQAILIGGLISSFVLSAVFTSVDIAKFFYVPYFVLGGWQLFFALFIRYLFRYRGMDTYIRLIGIFAMAAAFLAGISYLGTLTHSGLEGFIFLFILLISFVPPIFAVYRFAGAYSALHDKITPYEESLVS